ncbi:MAG: hypothetical protein LKJ80_06875 [Oscillibacter sp.]|nr:hypothetical protein [Oscillibacter sp.]
MKYGIAAAAAACTAEVLTLPVLAAEMPGAGGRHDSLYLIFALAALAGLVCVKIWAHKNRRDGGEKK